MDQSFQSYLGFIILDMDMALKVYLIDFVTVKILITYLVMTCDKSVSLYITENPMTTKYFVELARI